LRTPKSIRHAQLNPASKTKTSNPNLDFDMPTSRQMQAQLAQQKNSAFKLKTLRPAFIHKQVDQGSQREHPSMSGRISAQKSFDELKWEICGSPQVGQSSKCREFISNLFYLVQYTRKSVLNVFGFFAGIEEFDLKYLSSEVFANFHLEYLLTPSYSYHYHSYKRGSS